MILFAKFRRVLAALALVAAACASGLPTPAGAAELVVFLSARCPYCIAWEREIGRMYAKTWEARVAPLRRVDLDLERSADLGGLEEVRVTPTFVLVEEGRELGRIEGYSGNEFFWPQLDELLAKLRGKPS